MKLDAREWKDEICPLFHHHPENVAPEYMVKIPNFKRKLLPVQIHGIFKALQTIHGKQKSLILGHVMGIGKTTQAIAALHIQNIINHMREDIKFTRKKHWDAAKMNESDKCPMNKERVEKYGFDCPCWPKSPTFFIKQRLGIGMIMVPLGLLDVWKYEFAQCAPLNPDGSQVRLAIAHHSSKTNEQISKADWDLLCGKETKRQDDNGIALASYYKARVENGRVVVLTTTDSAESQFIKDRRNQQCNKTYITPPPTSRTNKDGKTQQVQGRAKEFKSDVYQACVVSIIIKDEMHLRKTSTTKAIGQVQKAQQNNRQATDIALCLMTGTPLSSGPSDIADLVELMIAPSWKEDEVLKNWMGNELVQLGKEWDNIIKKDKLPEKGQTEGIITKITPLVEKIILRVTTTSSFFGQPPVKVPKNVYYEQVCVHEKKWANASNNLYAIEEKGIEARDKIRQDNYMKQHGDLEGFTPLSKNNTNLYYKSRLVASFPYLQALKNKDGTPLKLTQREWEEQTKGKDGANRWVDGKPGQDPYFDNINKICESSGKCHEIKKQLDNYKDVIDGEGKPARLIFCSYFYAGARILYLVGFEK